MVYDAILNGARALAFYGGQNPKCWGSSTRRRLELDVLGARARAARARDLGGEPARAGAEEPGDDARASDVGPLGAAISRRGRNGELWVIAVRGGGEGSWTRRSAGFRLPSADVYAENRSVPIVGGALADSFGGGRFTCTA